MANIRFIRLDSEVAKIAVKVAADHLRRPLGPYCEFVELRQPYALLKEIDAMQKWGDQHGAPFEWTAVGMHASLKMNLLVLDFHDQNGPFAFKMRFG